MRTILVSGALANKPFNGGNAWTRLSWVTGFQRLGFDVCFVEQIASEHCIDREGRSAAFQDSVNLEWFRQVMARFGLARSSALIADDGAMVCGMSINELCRKASEPGALLNISGHLTHPEIRGSSGCSIYYDDDPGFTQFWHAAGNDGARLSGHDFHYTIGENIGSAGCGVPVGDIVWRHTRAPVVLEDWPVMNASKAVAFDRFTTVASWRGAYGAVEFGGKRYGAKAHEFRKLLELPRRTGRSFEIALQIHPGDARDCDHLKAHGWHLVDPVQVAGSPDTFRGYIQGSGAEFSVAQGLYVETNSGWFSDRTVRYLASGKPALVQDTGFSRHIRTGEGLLVFGTLAEAAEGAERIVREYERHCRAARKVAEEFFDSDRILSKMVHEAGLELPSTHRDAISKLS